MKNATILLLPSVFAASLAWWQYQPQALPLVQQPSPSLAPTTRVKELPYPEFGSLAAIERRELLSASVIRQPVTSSSHSEKQLPTTAQAQESVNEQGVALDELDLSTLSPELAMRVQSAFSSTERAPASASESQGENPTVSLEKESARFKGLLPALNLQTHMFASNEQSRWIKVNGKEVHQGEWITPQVQLLTITPRTVVIGYAGEQIELPALYEWRG